MKILLKAALRSKKNLHWFFFSFITLIGITIANQIEMITLGVIIHNAEGQEHLEKKASNHPVHYFLQRVKKTFQSKGYGIQNSAIFLLFVALFKAFFLFFSRYVTRVLSIKISKDLRQQYFSHIQTLSMSFYQKYNIGSLSTRVVNDAGQIALSIHSWMINYFHTPVTIFMTFSVCFYLSWQLSLIIFIGLPLVIFPVRLITKKVKRITQSLQENQETFASVLIDYLVGIQTVKIFSMEAYTLKKYAQQNKKMESSEIKTSRYDLMTRPILHFVTTFCLVIILFIGLYGMKIPLAEMVIFCGLLHLFYEPVRKFADENASVQRGIVAAERLFEVLNIQAEIQDQKNAIEITSFDKELEFRDVWFRYEKEWVLKGLSFTVKKGQSVAIVGATGSGKSTILQLIARLYEVEKGAIFFDGEPIYAYTQKSLRSLISYVPQKPFLFNDTIFQNIIYGKKASEKGVVQAAKEANAHEFISQLPKEYQTNLSDMGRNLSGGQQQRLAMARAFFKTSSLLMLDEATSSLDATSEQKIKHSLQTSQKDVTQIIVAHRFSTIEHVDKIIFIEKGKKIAEGSKKELFDTCPLFQEMWTASLLEDVEKDLVEA